MLCELNAIPEGPGKPARMFIFYLEKVVIDPIAGVYIPIIRISHFSDEITIPNGGS